MITAPASRPGPIEPSALARAKYDERGVFLEGRDAELHALAEMGKRDPSLGRLYEGHLNAALLVALYGTGTQRRRAYADVDAGHLFGVWNTQDDDPVRIARAGAAYELSGAKTWASGADCVTRALITARTEDDGIVMCLVPVDRSPIVIDASAWLPLGMQASNSFRVSFDGVVVTGDDIVGRPGDYERSPWFLGGAIRFVAVHVGIVERIAAETFACLLSKQRTSDPHQCARAGRLHVAAVGARNWVRFGRDAWCDYDRTPTVAAASTAVNATDMARVAVERAALDACELAVRSVGAHGLVSPHPLPGLVRDLTMYLRQPAPDAVIARVGSNALSGGA